MGGVIRESLCDVCVSPGHCCKRLFLSGEQHTGDRIEWPRSHESAEHRVMRAGLPFVPTEQLWDGRWTYSCLELLDDGRCGIYDRRPQLCRDYAPGTDRLCVHFVEPSHG